MSIKILFHRVVFVECLVVSFSSTLYALYAVFDLLYCIGIFFTHSTIQTFTKLTKFWRLDTLKNGLKLLQ